MRDGDHLVAGEFRSLVYPALYYYDNYETNVGTTPHKRAVAAGPRKVLWTISCRRAVQSGKRAASVGAVLSEKHVPRVHTF